MHNKVSASFQVVTKLKRGGILKKKFFALLASMVLTIVLSGCSQYYRRMTPSQPQPRVTPKTIISASYEKAELSHVIVTAKKAPVTTGTYSGAPTITSLSNGTKVKVLGKVGDWYVTHLPDNRVGCLSAGSTKPATPAATQSIPNIPGSTTNNPSNDEVSMVNLVNSARTSAGLKPLATNAELTKLARLKSKDLVDHNTFTHISPTYGSPFDMMKKYGISYLYAAENLAKSPSVQAAETALMNSAGHKANILNPSFTEIGIGIISANDGTNVYTQMFIGK